MEGAHGQGAGDETAKQEGVGSRATKRVVSGSGERRDNYGTRLYDSAQTHAGSFGCMWGVDEKGDVGDGDERMDRILHVDS